MTRHYTDRDYTWAKCPCCDADLQFLTGSEPAITHLIRCAQEKVAKEHPEVSDQLELGEGAESEDEMFPPEDSDHHSSR